MKVGICVGRWQVAWLHDGHMALLDYVRGQSDVMVVFIGVTPGAPTVKNPLDFMTRALMISQSYPKAIILPIMDEDNDTVWSEKLDGMIKPLGGSPVLYGSRDSFLPSYTGRYTVAEVPSSACSISGTDSRAKIVVPEHFEQFRRGVIYSQNNARPKIYPTVDVAVCDNKGVLLGRKPHEDGWRFPGGFVDLKDEGWESAARRELREETGLDFTEDQFQYVGSWRMNDWRYREENKIFTTLFMVECPESYMQVHMKASDDLVQLQFCKWKELPELMQVHEQLMYELCKKRETK